MSRWLIRIGLILLIVIFVPLILYVLKPTKQQSPKNSKDLRQIKDAITPSERFSYDTVEAPKILEKYIRDNIKEEFLPSKIDIQQNLIASGKLDGTDYEFGANWKLGNINFHATFHYISNTNDIRDTEFYIDLPYVKDNINSVQAETLVETYLKKVPDGFNFDCGTFKETTKFCEYFVVEEMGKRGFGTVRGKDESNKDILLIFSCFIPKNDLYYNKRTSCLLFREKDFN